MITRLLVAFFLATVLGVAQTELNMFFFSTTEPLFRESIEEERSLAAKRGDSFGVATAKRLLSEGDPAGYGEFIAKLEKKLEAWKASELQKGAAGAFCGKILDVAIMPLSAQDSLAQARLRMRDQKGEILLEGSRIISIKLGVDRAAEIVLGMIRATPPTKMEPPKMYRPSKASKPMAKVKAQPREEAALFAYNKNPSR